MKTALVTLVVLALLTVPHPSFGQSALVLQFVGFSPNVSPADKLECRQAIAYALNRSAIVSALSSQVRGIREAYTIQHPNLPGYNPGFAKYRYDPTKAKDLWGQCGAAGPLTVRTGPSQGWQAIYYPMLKDTLETTLGASVVIAAGDFGALIADAKAGRVPIYLSGWRAERGDYDPNSLPLSIGDYLVSDPDVKAAVARRDTAVTEQLLLDKALIIPVFHF